MPPNKILLAALIGLSHFPAYAQESQPVDKEAEKQFSIDFASCEQPVWPAGALERGDKGRSELKFRVDTDGKVLETLVLKSSGFAWLDEASQSALRKCSYTPPAKLGRTSPVWARLAFLWAPEAGNREKWRRDMVLAESGDAAAMFRMGVGYLYGNPDRTISADLGMRLLRSAAGLGHVEAQKALAFQLQVGRFTVVDLDEAAMWAKKAAAQAPLKPANTPNE
ncbi:energy transducer TonB [Pseudoduganella violaceinigra]|uniref:energy transducer TonB n=1 Tax=Pseudoduganella violaceinigra TaxID=246602 RepID=UPI000424D7BE|nr:energy transducer TonB [Pseudoduganella violaceinigra]